MIVGLLTGAVGGYTGVCVADSSDVRSALLCWIIIIGYMVLFMVPCITKVINTIDRWYAESVTTSRAI